GEGSNVVRIRADGEFPRQEDDVLISLELTEPCLTRERVPGVGTRRLGVDCARFGSDRTTLVLRQGRVVEQIAIFAKQDTMVSVGGVLAVLDGWRVEEMAVALIGLGAGVYARLVEPQRQGRFRCPVVGVNVSEAPPVEPRQGEPRPRRMRDYLWLSMAAWLRD